MTLLSLNLLQLKKDLILRCVCMCVSAVAVEARSVTGSCDLKTLVLGTKNSGLPEEQQRSF